MNRLWLILPALLCVGAGYWFNTRAIHERVLAVCLAGVLWAWIEYDRARLRGHLQKLARARRGETICGFARSFNPRAVDTWIIRATYEEVQSALAYYDDIPLHATDSLEKTLGIDSESLGDIAADIAERSGRSTENFEHNPYFGKVETVADLTMFVNLQAKA
jgi:hypothetical protein